MNETIIGSVIGGAFASLTALIVMRCEFKREDNENLKKYERNKKIAIRKIAQFLSPEIFSNISNLYKNKEFKGRVESPVHPNCVYNSKDISTSEYDVSKEEVFKYQDSYLDEVIQIYHIFKLLQREDNLNGFRDTEMNRIRNLYKLYDSILIKSDELLKDY